MIQPGVKIPTGETYLRTGTTLARLRSGYGNLVNLASGRSGHQYQNYPRFRSAIRRHLMVPLEEALQIRSLHPSLRTEGPSAKPLSTKKLRYRFVYLLLSPLYALCRVFTAFQSHYHSHHSSAVWHVARRLFERAFSFSLAPTAER